MEKYKGKIFKILFFIIILLAISVIFKQVSYAENEEANTTINQANSSENNNTTTSGTTNDNQNTDTSSTNESKTTTNNNQEKNVSKKSTNANLKNLGIKPHDFSGFKPGITSYEVTVPTDTESVEVYATPQDSKAKVSGTGTKKLEIGENKFEVTVTSESGNQKTYTINVKREGEQGENTEVVQEKYSGDGLSDLTIENLQLSPKFDTVIYEYSIKYIGEKTSLDIKATPTDPYYVVEITGNEELKEGENIINILVSDPDGNNVATYQITVTKSLVDEEAIVREQKEKQKRILMVGGVIALVILTIAIVLIIRHRRNSYWDDDYEEDEEDLGQENDEDINKINDDEVSEQKLDETVHNTDDEGTIWTKEQAREKFLDNYSNLDVFEEEQVNKKIINRKQKGKRFK